MKKSHSFKLFQIDNDIIINGFVPYNIINEINYILKRKKRELNKISAINPDLNNLFII